MRSDPLDSDDDPLNPDADPFKPPAEAVEVECLHCGRRYQSDLLQWRIETCGDGSQRGFWRCPMPDCDGRGFGFDILPTDPAYHDERGGWVYGEEGDEVDEAEGEFATDEGDVLRRLFDQTPGEDGHPLSPADLDDDIPF